MLTFAFKKRRFGFDQDPRDEGLVTGLKCQFLYTSRFSLLPSHGTPLLLFLFCFIFDFFPLILMSSFHFLGDFFLLLNKFRQKRIYESLQHPRGSFPFFFVLFFQFTLNIYVCNYFCNRTFIEIEVQLIEFN